MAGCAEIGAGIDPGCSATKKIGGVDKRVYIFNINDIDPAELTFGVSGEVTAFGLLTGKKLYAFKGKKEKHNGKSTVVEGENVNLFTQELALVLYAETAVERASLRALLKGENLCAITESNAGQLEIWGLSNQASPAFDNYGLKCTAGEFGTGTLLNDDTSAKGTLTATVPNEHLLFIPASSLPDNIALLDALLV